jgi:hypothetical protein
VKHGLKRLIITSEIVRNCLGRQRSMLRAAR